jgi:hypothetical protein
MISTTPRRAASHAAGHWPEWELGLRAAVAAHKSGGLGDRAAARRVDRA